MRPHSWEVAEAGLNTGLSRHIVRPSFTPVRSSGARQPVRQDGGVAGPGGTQAVALPAYFPLWGQHSPGGLTTTLRLPLHVSHLLPSASLALTVAYLSQVLPSLGPPRPEGPASSATGQAAVVSGWGGGAWSQETWNPGLATSQPGGLSFLTVIRGNEGGHEESPGPGPGPLRCPRS